MTATERRASFSLASIFALRMLGLFLVLPVFALEAARYPGGDDPVRIGLAMGIYGLTQALLQIPFGLASDRLGRKPVIVAGLLVFALGSFVAGTASSLDWLLAGRALQGAGAVSAAVTALLADQTRDEVRTKAMALVGGSIGLMFAVSLVLAPELNARIGLSGLFWLTGLLALGAIAMVLWLVPPEPKQHKDMERAGLASVVDVGGGAGASGAGGLAQGAALAGLFAGGAGVVCGDGRRAVSAGAPGPFARGDAGRDCLAAAGAAGLHGGGAVRRYRSAFADHAGRAAAAVFLQL